MYVVTFTDFTPPLRADGQVFNRVRIEEGPAEDGPWTQIDEIMLNPLDTDGLSPLPRTFTTEEATIEEGWYKVTFLDLSGDMSQPVAPIHNVQQDLPEYLATTSDVGAIARTRTVDSTGTELGTFTSKTRPTNAEVNRLLVRSARDVEQIVGRDIPDVLIQDARDLVALRAAMYIELTYFPEQVAANRSPYQEYKALWDDAMGKPGKPGTFVIAVEGAGDNIIDVEQGAGLPFYGFPDDGMIGLSTVM